MSSSDWMLTQQEHIQEYMDKECVCITTGFHEIKLNLYSVDRSVILY